MCPLVVILPQLLRYSYASYCWWSILWSGNWLLFCCNYIHLVSELSFIQQFASCKQKLHITVLYRWSKMVVLLGFRSLLLLFTIVIDCFLLCVFSNRVQFLLDNPDSGWVCIPSAASWLSPSLFHLWSHFSSLTHVFSCMIFMAVLISHRCFHLILVLWLISHCFAIRTACASIQISDTTR